MNDNLLPDPPGKLEKRSGGSGGLVSAGTFERPIELQLVQAKQRTQTIVVGSVCGTIFGCVAAVGIAFYSLSRATPNAALESAIVEQGKQIKQLSKLAEEPKCKNTLVCVIPSGGSSAQEPDPYSGMTYEEMARRNAERNRESEINNLRQQWQDYCVSVQWTDQQCATVPRPEQVAW